jgi:tetratricopeptide (TPR) repeat protein
MLARVPERLRSEGVVLVPALPVVGVFVYWAAHGGGYAPSTWEPSALLLLGLLVATVIGLGPGRLRVSRLAAIALGALTAYVAWSYLSILWAEAPGDAFEGSNRALLYLIAFALFAVLPWRTWTALATLIAFSLGVGVIAVVTLIQLRDPDAVHRIFVEGRLTDPTGYVNSTAALFTIGAIVAIAIAARKEVPFGLRAALLTLATASLQASVLSESRGWLFALPVLAVVFVAIMPSRLRAVSWSLLPIAGTLVALPSLLQVFERSDSARTVPVYNRVVADAAHHAGAVTLLSCTAVLALAVVMTLADQRITVAASFARRANHLAAALVVIALVAGVVTAFAATRGNPFRKVADYWDRSSTYQPYRPGSSRFGTVGSNRPDFWRVSIDAFAAHPIGGLGQDNWSAYYLERRRSGEAPRWVHSLELRLLAHTGIVGFLAFAVFLTASARAALTHRRRASPLRLASAAAALLPAVVWLVHGSIDWFWEVPALSGPAFAFLAVAGALMSSARESRVDEAAVAPREAGATRSRGELPIGSLSGNLPASPTDATMPRGRLALRLTIAVVLGCAALAAALALGVSALAERDIAAASSDWRADPVGALSQLDDASRLNPLGSRADFTAGVIALELRQPLIAEQRFRRALDRDPDNAFGYLGLGLANSELGDRVRARSAYLRAEVLNPREDVIREAVRRVDGPHPLSSHEAFDTLLGMDS